MNRKLPRPRYTNYLRPHCCMLKNLLLPPSKNYLPRFLIFDCQKLPGGQRAVVLRFSIVRARFPSSAELSYRFTP